MQGKIVKVHGSSKIQVTPVRPPPDDQDVHHLLDKKVKVLLNGQPSTLGALKNGDLVEIEGQPAVLIRATR